MHRLLHRREGKGKLNGYAWTGVAIIEMHMAARTNHQGSNERQPDSRAGQIAAKAGLCLIERFPDVFDLRRC